MTNTSLPTSSLTPAPVSIEITSFSFHAPLPAHLFARNEGRHGGGFIFDCRSLPNPGRQPCFAQATGLDREVCTFLAAAPEVADFMRHSEALVHAAIQNFIDRSFTFMSVGFGCTGGQHRSVYCAERLKSSISSKFGATAQVVVLHHNLERLGLLP